MKGLVFDIEEFAVFDGPGIRSTVFLKGCPLRCQWCHNPEGLEMRPQRMVAQNLCKHCGICEKVCPHPDHCIACGACIPTCPTGAIRISGKWMTSDQVADHVLRNAQMLKDSGGGVTFSGGEIMMQPEFVIECRKKMAELHAIIETSGFASEKVYQSVIENMDYVIQDIKIMDPEMAKKYMGVDNAPILRNIKLLMKSGIPFRIRIPLIPGITDTPENMEAAAKWIEGAENLDMVELLPYNKAAGAKYSSLGKTYSPDFDEKKSPVVYTAPFESRNMEVHVL